MEGFSDNIAAFRFKGFELDPIAEQLFHKEQRLKIEPQLFSLLLLFLNHRNTLVTRQQIEDQVWTGRPVSDEAIRAAVKKLRELLRDDARAPVFIKTIPKQGYKWLAPVDVKNNSTVLKKRKGVWQSPYFRVIFVVFICVAVFLGYYSGLTTSDSQIAETSEPHLNLEKLTSLPGSEVFADYHAASNKLVFLHRDARNSPQQLFIKDLNTQAVSRLSWDNVNYSNSFWSKDGRKLAFNRLINSEPGTWVVHLDEQNEISQLHEITHPQIANKFVIGWLADDSGLLLAEEMQPAKQHRIYQYSFQTKELIPISSPNVAGRGDYLAAQSHDGSKLAILREIANQQTSLVIVDRSTGNLLANKSLPFLASRMAWQRDDKAVILTSFFGESTHYMLDTDFFDNSLTLPDNSLDIYASCGQRCYILRQHNGNFQDIQETPLPSPIINGPVLQPGRLLKFAGAQDFPRYIEQNNQLIFVSLIEKSLRIQKLDNMNRVHELGVLPGNYRINALSVAPDGSQIVGVANRRLFVLAVKEQSVAFNEPRFLTDALEQIHNPVWHRDNRKIYFAQMVSNRPAVVLYDPESDNRTVVIEGYSSFQPLKDNDNFAVATDTNRVAWLLGHKAGVWQPQHLIAQLASDNIHQWQVKNDTLYFIKRSGRDSILCTTKIFDNDDNTTELCQSVGNNRFRLNFDIHPSQQKALLVESLSAESDIVKLTW